MFSFSPAPYAQPCPAPFNLAAHVLRGAQAHPDRIALQILRTDGAERFSYARIEAAVRGVATGLVQAGLGPGDRVMMRLGNGVAFPLLFLGAIAAGIQPVVCSSQLTLPEVDAIAADLAPRLVVAEKGLSRPAAVPVLEAADLRAMEALAPAPYDLGDPDRPAYIIYTSGTSGKPRAVLHAHRTVWARQMMLKGWSGLGPQDRLLHAGAMNWTYTLGAGLLDPWVAGATALVPDAGVTAAQLPLLLRRFDATIFAAAPGIFRQMLKAGAPLPMPRLRHGLSAGEKLSDRLRAAWVAATGTPLYEALGLSECSTFISSSPDRPAPQGAIGYPQAGRRIAVLGSCGEPVLRGSEGMIAVHRTDPGLFLTYADAPHEAQGRFSGDWFLTGDRGVMHSDGAVTYLGRSDDMMNAGGFRVSPVEVEAALADASGLDACAAVELRIKADTTVIALFHVGTAGEEDLKALAEARLARYKRPRIYVRMDALPRTPMGKTNRRALRDSWGQGHDQA